MIKFSDLKKGDYVLAENDNQAWQGEVTDFNNDEKEVEVNNGIQEFWFTCDQLFPITLDEKQLLKMKFTKAANEDGSIKYMKGAFRIQTPQQDNFSNFEIWYKNEKRIIQQPIFLHQLQNHYLEMTKVHLTDDPA
ncbi:MAG: hypothetical protein JSS98_02275 [Bacteroidetes bacterium]|nr:hypothetical protein [Bacteroidota bacterium]